MNSLIAIDPIEPKGKTFERFCEALKLYQEKGILSQTTVASVIHPWLYTVPNQWYRDTKAQLAREALHRVETACTGRFSFESTKVFQSDSPANDILVAQLSKFGKRNGNDLLVVSSNSRSGLPHWTLGSFAETAALTSTLPVLVIKPHWQKSTYSRNVRFLLAVDTNAPPSTKQLRWITKIAKASNASIDLVYVEPKRRIVTDAILPQKHERESLTALKGMQKTLRSKGVSTEVHFLRETKSSAHALTELADRRKSWMTITISTKRSLPYKLLLGSTARRTLSLTARPFLSLRQEQ